MNQFIFKHLTNFQQLPVFDAGLKNDWGKPK
jgi:hypothetical protein